MHWNHRVIVQFNDGFDPLYCIHEVYYEGDKIDGWTAAPIRLMGDDKKSLLQTLGYIKKALDKPFLMEQKVGRKTVLVEYVPDKK